MAQYLTSFIAEKYLVTCVWNIHSSIEGHISCFQVVEFMKTGAITIPNLSNSANLAESNVF